MYEYTFTVSPTNFSYEVKIKADNLNDAMEKVCEQENVDFEYVQFKKMKEI